MITLTPWDIALTLVIGVISTWAAAPLGRHLARLVTWATDLWYRRSTSSANKRLIYLENKLLDYNTLIADPIKFSSFSASLIFKSIYSTIDVVFFIMFFNRFDDSIIYSGYIVGSICNWRREESL